MASYAEELALWPRRVPGSRTETGGRFEERGGGETMGDSEDSGRENLRVPGSPQRVHQLSGRASPRPQARADPLPGVQGVYPGRLGG